MNRKTEKRSYLKQSAPQNGGIDPFSGAKVTIAPGRVNLTPA
jgi:hypothetical protein